MGRASKTDVEAQNAIKAMIGKKSLRAFSIEIGFNRGYLSSVINGKRPASNALRHALGLPPHTVTVSPLSCGCPPTGTRCKVHGKPRSTTQNATRKRSKRIEAMRAGVQLTRTLDRMTG